MDCNLKVIKCEENGGKGLAVKIGMLNCVGEKCLFADADGATKIESFSEMENELENIIRQGLGVVVGSRNHNKVNVTRQVRGK